MRFFNKFLIFISLNLIFIPFARSTCYFVYSPSKTLIHRSTESPVDLSLDIQSQIKNRFGNGSHMIFSNTTPSNNCSEMNSVSIAREIAEAQELERVRLTRQRSNEEAQKKMLLAAEEEKIRLAVEHAFIQKRDQEHHEKMIRISTGNYNQELEKKFKDQVLNYLKDPDSAKFRELRIVNNGKALCGFVNAKNSFGGYVGFNNFVSDDEGVYMETNTSRSGDWEKFIANTLYLKKSIAHGCS